MCLWQAVLWRISTTSERKCLWKAFLTREIHEITRSNYVKGVSKTWKPAIPFFKEAFANLGTPRSATVKYLKRDLRWMVFVHHSFWWCSKLIKETIFTEVGFVLLLVNIIKGNLLLNVIFNTLQIDNTKKKQWEYCMSIAVCDLEFCNLICK